MSLATGFDKDWILFFKIILGFQTFYIAYSYLTFSAPHLLHYVLRLPSPAKCDPRDPVTLAVYHVQETNGICSNKLQPGRISSVASNEKAGQCRFWWLLCWTATTL